MANHMMFWRSAELEQAIHKNRPQRSPSSDRRHVACSDHSPAELAAFERSLGKPVATPWKSVRPTRH